MVFDLFSSTILSGIVTKKNPFSILFIAPNLFSSTISFFFSNLYYYFNSKLNTKGLPLIVKKSINSSKSKYSSDSNNILFKVSSTVSMGN